MNELERYKERVRELERWLTDATTVEMRIRYQRAIDLSNVAVQDWIRLTDAAEEESAAYTAYADCVVASIAAQARALESDVSDVLQTKVASGDELARTQLQSDRRALLLKIQAVGARQETHQYMDMFRSRLARSAPQMTEVLFTKIFAPNHSAFVKEAVIDGIEVAIGFVPAIGTVYDIARRLLDHDQAGRRATRATDQRIRYLDDYTAALEAWRDAAQVATRRLESAAPSYEC